MKRLTTFIAGAAVAATLGGCQQPAVSGWKSFSGDKNIERRVDSVLFDDLGGKGGADGPILL